MKLKDLYSLFKNSVLEKGWFSKASLKRERISIPKPPGSALSFLLLLVSELYERGTIYVSKEDELENIFYDLEELLSDNLWLIINKENLPNFTIFKNRNKGVLLLEESLLAEKVKIDKETQFYMEIGSETSQEELIEWMLENGYEQEDLVTEPLEFSKRGGIVDVFPPYSKNPVRIEFFGDTIISMREFDSITQRSIGKIESVELPTRNLKEGKRALKEYFSDLVVVGKDGNITLAQEPEAPISQFQPLDVFLGDFDRLNEVLKRLEIIPYFVIEAESTDQYIKKRFNDAIIIKANLSGGYLDEEKGYAVITERELFGVRKKRKKPTGFKGLPKDSLYSLKKGDYVVHIDYGIGIFQGLTRLRVNEVEKDFLEIHYKNEDKLYIPVENIGLIDRYIGAEDKPPKISRLNSPSWGLIKRNVETKVYEYAKELLDLYATRKITKGYAFGKHTEEMEFLSLSFPYQETPDQLAVLNEVFKDMESDKPVDRLICGEVGYGKTELAVRASLKACLDYKQVCILAPTTILTLQHYETFKTRLNTFPVRIEMLSRFVSPSKREQILKDLEEGKIDIIIGTHSLLSPKVKFKDLGLLIIDEEHRFGVKQKEKIKKLKTNIDVLSLTATPIPRTLYMGLTGIRDISKLETPPIGRKDIITEISHWDEELIRKWVYREKMREGLTLFIHNRIETIKTIQKKLKEILPGVKIGIAHAKLKEKELAKIYKDFINKKYDMLVSTAIVEAGLDVPDLNTIIINRADMFGLADLHQLRGRVGRRDKQAYALFLIPKQLTPEAKKRLAAIRTYSKLGSGFRLAIRDMEIRGVGNILGTQQHGHIQRIGFSLYTRLLKEAIAKLKGEEPEIEPRLEVDIEAYIPQHYIPSSSERVSLYKRMLSLEDKIDLAKFKEELRDRFGLPPQPVENMLLIAELRTIAKSKRIAVLKWKNKNYEIIRDGKIMKGSASIKEFKKILEKLELKTR